MTPTLSLRAFPLSVIASGFFSVIASQRRSNLFFFRGSLWDCHARLRRARNDKKRTPTSSLRAFPLSVIARCVSFFSHCEVRFLFQSLRGALATKQSLGLLRALSALAMTKKGAMTPYLSLRAKGEAISSFSVAVSGIATPDFVGLAMTKKRTPTSSLRAIFFRHCKHLPLSSLRAVFFRHCEHFLFPSLQAFPLSVIASVAKQSHRISSYKSFHSGFILSMRAIFFLLLPALICFSLSMAVSMSACIS